MCSGQRVPEIMNWYALEDGDENVCNSETDNKMVAPQEDAAELDDGEDAVLEEDATDLNSSDIMTCIAIKAREAVNGVAHTWSI